MKWGKSRNGDGKTLTRVVTGGREHSTGAQEPALEELRKRVHLVEGIARAQALRWDQGGHLRGRERDQWG